jgi:hypothetical protein
LLLEGPKGSSFLAASLSSAAELTEDNVDTAATNDVCWGIWSALAAAFSHFQELGPELELLGSRCNADLTDDQMDALWAQARLALDSLASFIPSLVARGCPDSAGGE